MIVAGVLLAIGLGFLIHALTADKEPVYQGKRLSAWLNDSYEPSYLNTQLDPAAVKAVQAIGTNALPYLLKMIKTRDSQLKLRLVIKLQWYVRIHIPTHLRDRQKAMFGFQALGEAAKPAYPAVVKLVLDSDEDHYAIDSLQNADADTFVLLAEGLHSPDARVRRRTAEALIELQEWAPSIATPALTRALSDPDESVRQIASVGLIGYYSQTNSAIPASDEVTNTVDSYIRIAAIEALKRIDIDTNAPATPGEKKE